MNTQNHKKIIARLDIKGERLVKGINLEGLRTLGIAEVYSRYYTDQGIDELLIMDTVASLYGRENLFNFVKTISNDIFIPITVGGGLKTLEDLQEAFMSGADKVVLNTAIIDNPDLINEAVQHFGSSSIVASIEAKKTGDDEWSAYYNNGRTNSGMNVIDWVKEVQERGVGKVFITDIDSDGTGQGFETVLFEKIVPICQVPLSASGGAGKKEDCLAIAPYVTAICIASLLHYGVPEDVKDKALALQKTDAFAPVRYNYTNKNLEFSSIEDIKMFLSENGYDMRISY